MKVSILDPEIIINNNTKFKRKCRICQTHYITDNKNNIELVDAIRMINSDLQLGGIFSLSKYIDTIEKVKKIYCVCPNCNYKAYIGVICSGEIYTESGNIPFQ